MHQIDRATTPTTGEKHTALNELTNTGQTNIHINLTTNNLIASNFLFTAHPLKCESRKLELAIGQEVCASYFMCVCVCVSLCEWFFALKEITSRNEKLIHLNLMVLNGDKCF